jgi:ABC-2 type transport system permease protein
VDRRAADHRFLSRATHARAALTLAWREVIRFLRQPHRIIGALGQPIVFWLLFGIGLHRPFRLGDTSEATFLRYNFPGMVVLLLLFTAIFSTISLIEDRREGFLQGVLVAPIPRWAMVMGKLLGGSALAVGQALLLLLLSALLGIFWPWTTWLVMVAYLSVVALALTGLGFVLAWRADSTQGFHAVMSLLLMPLWLLSGAFFPVPAVNTAEVSQLVMHWIMRLNPLTYAVAGLRYFMYGWILPQEYWEPGNIMICWMVTLLFAVVMLWAACSVARTQNAGAAL